MNHSLRDGTEKQKILAPGTVEGPWKLDELLAGKSKIVFYVETEKAVYVANDLDTAMRLWAGYSMAPPIAETIGKRDATKVINVTRIG